MIMELTGAATKRSAVSDPITREHRDQQLDKELVRMLATSALFRDYQQAFGKATGLPLTLRAVEDWQLAQAGEARQSSFCALVAQQNGACAACLRLQQQVCNAAQTAPATQQCAFGLNETAVAVKLGDRVIGYLQTGRILFKPPTARQAAKALQQLKALGVTARPAEATRAYLQTRVIPRPSYDAVIRLLEYFARQLGLMGNQVALQSRPVEPPQVVRARQYIQDHCGDPISLSEVARHAAISPFYLCKKFKEVTGLHFTDYVSRLRVERAKELLRDPNHRISEVAFRTGFQSLSHFNRCFKRVAGESPTACRQQLQ